jgi:ABC-type branched-subunit amino acid transport system substrate-binding protein
MYSYRTGFAAATVVLLVGGIAACGSASNSQPGTPGPAGTASGSGQSASGTPVNIYDIGPDPNSPLNPTGGQAGMEAGVKAVNNSGGINGHPIHVTFCSALNGTATQAVQCAQSAAQDSSVVGDIGNNSVYDQIDPILLNAGMVVSGYTIGPGDNTPSNSFPLVAGGFIPQASAAAAVATLHAKKVCQAYIDDPGVGGQGALINQYVLNPQHLSLYKNIVLPPTAADLSPQAAQASGCDAIVITSSAQQSVQYIEAVRALGNKVALICNTAVSPTVLQAALGANPANVYDIAWFDRSSAGYAEYGKEMRALGYAGTQYDNDNSTMAWAALKEFVAIAKSLPTVTRATVLAAYKKQASVTTMGLTPEINFTVPQSAASGQYPVIRNDTTVLYHYEGSKYVLVGDPGKPFLPIFQSGNSSLAVTTRPFAAS